MMNSDVYQIQIHKIFYFNQYKRYSMKKVIITNEDNSFNTFVKILYSQGLLKDIDEIRCQQIPAHHTETNKFKKVSLQYTPWEGKYKIKYNEHEIILEIRRGTHVLTTQCRQINYLRQIIIEGETLEIAKGFVQYVFSKIEDEDENTDKICIYENNGGYWDLSKQKKPRSMESVIFRKQFIETVTEDVKEFIDSQAWYEQMGIPYKRSYLLYGPPGTGKSSFAQALAGHIKYSICFVNCSDRISDYDFNNLLNWAPKKSIILIEDVDSIFSERKNVEKNNALTFSGFLNAIDGVRSQEGRILIMTTNYKERLDPALLRPGRVDEMFQINHASHYQLEKLCLRFYKNEELARNFADKLPENKFSMSLIQGFLMKFRKCPQKIIQSIDKLLESDENIKIEQYLQEVNCMQVINDFKIEQCYTLSHARSLPKDILQKMIEKLDSTKKGRFLDTIRTDRKNYLKNYDQLKRFIEQSYSDEKAQLDLKQYIKDPKIRTFFQIRDKGSEIMKPIKTEAKEQGGKEPKKENESQKIQKKEEQPPKEKQKE